MSVAKVIIASFWRAIGLRESCRHGMKMSQWCNNIVIVINTDFIPIDWTLSVVSTCPLSTTSVTHGTLMYSCMLQLLKLIVLIMSVRFANVCIIRVSVWRLPTAAAHARQLTSAFKNTWRALGGRKFC